MPTLDNIDPADFDADTPKYLGEFHSQRVDIPIKLLETAELTSVLQANSFFSKLASDTTVPPKDGLFYFRQLNAISVELRCRDSRNNERMLQSTQQKLKESQQALTALKQIQSPNPFVVQETPQPSAPVPEPVKDSAQNQETLRKMVRTELLSDLPLFDVTKGRADSRHARTFLRQWSDLAQDLELNDKELVALMRKKMDPSSGETVDWAYQFQRRFLQNHQARPTFHDWIKEIESTCDINRQISEAVGALERLSMENKYPVFHRQWLKLVTQAEKEDSHDLALRFIQKLPGDLRRSVLTNVQYRSKLANQQLSVFLLDRWIREHLDIEVQVAHANRQTNSKPANQPAQSAPPAPKTQPNPRPKIKKAKVKSTAATSTRQPRSASQDFIDPSDTEALARALKSSRGHCYSCGSKDHIANAENCPHFASRGRRGVQSTKIDLPRNRQPPREVEEFSEEEDNSEIVDTTTASSDRYGPLITDGSNSTIAVASPSMVRSPVIKNPPPKMVSFNMYSLLPEADLCLPEVNSGLINELAGKAFVNTLSLQKTAPAGVPTYINKVPYLSNLQAITLAKFSNGARMVEDLLLADLGANANLMDPSLASKLGLKWSLVPEPVTAEFANKSTTVLDRMVTTIVDVGSYRAEISFLLCEIGNQVILGVPWFETIDLSLSLRRQQFQFTVPGSTTPLKIHNWELFTEKKEKQQQVSKEVKKRNQHIYLVSLAEARRYLKSATIFYIDLKKQDIPNEILDRPPTSKLDPDATARNSSSFDHIPLPAHQIVMEFAEIFDAPTELPPSRPENVQIQLLPNSSPPRVHGLSRLNASERELLQQSITTLLDRGQIRVSTSPYASRIMFIRKSDGTLRLCVDYRQLNDITIKNRCPIPNIADLRDQVQNAKFLTKVDCRDGYYNTRMDPDSIEKTAFKCALGLFEYTVMPFGLTNAPAIFQAMMNRILGSLYGVCVIVYLDDIVIYSQTEEDHIRDVKRVFKTLQEHQLKIKLSKCDFFQEKVEFCGHMLSGTGVSLATNKISAIQTPPKIRSKKDVQKFLGVMVWFQDFIFNYAAITQPITDLLKKDVVFSWTHKHDTAVATLIHAVTTAPTLRHFNPDLPTKVYSDASLYAIGGWISQQHPDGWHPVVFVSRKLKDKERIYSNPERELLALLYVLVKQGHYLRSGIPFESNVDCSSLEKIQQMDLSNRRIARWIMLLQDYNIQVKHISGKMNTVADYLTRNRAVAPTCSTCRKQMRIHKVTVSESLEEARNYTAAAAKDPVIAQFLEWDHHRSSHKLAFLFKQFKRVGDKWFFGKRIYVPSDETLRLSILTKYHDLAQSGHQGVKRTRHRLMQMYFWPGMEHDIRKFVRSCLTCQRHSQRNSLLHGELHPLPIPTDRFRDISIDFAHISTSANGYNSLMVVVDRLTKLVKLIPGHQTDSTAIIAQKFIDHWFCAGFGLPESIVSDRDSKFESALWSEITSKLKIKLELTTARHQQADGQAEIAIRTYKRTAQKFASLSNDDWDEKVAIMEFCLNNSVSASTGFAPFFLAFGFHPRVFPEEYITVDLKAIVGEDSNNLLTSIKNSISQAQDSLQSAQDIQQQQYNKRRVPAPQYKVGDVVFLDSTGINWPSHAGRPKESIPNYLGPFTISKFDSSRDNATLNFPLLLDRSRFFPTFHVSKLKPVSSREVLFPYWNDPFDRPEADLSGLFEVDRVVNKRIKHRKIEYLIGFKGYPDSHNEWQVFDPKQPFSWVDEWPMLQAFDPSVGPKPLPSPPTVHRFSRRNKQSANVSSDISSERITRSRSKQIVNS